MIKKGDCILIKPKDKWLCVKYYSHDIDYLYYVPMHIDMLHKRHIKKMKFGSDNVRNIHQTIISDFLYNIYLESDSKELDEWIVYLARENGDEKLANAIGDNE